MRTLFVLGIACFAMAGGLLLVRSLYHDDRSMHFLFMDFLFGALVCLSVWALSRNKSSKL